MKTQRLTRTSCPLSVRLLSILSNESQVAQLRVTTATIDVATLLTGSTAEIAGFGEFGPSNGRWVEAKTDRDLEGGTNAGRTAFELSGLPKSVAMGVSFGISWRVFHQSNTQTVTSPLTHEKHQYIFGDE